MNVIFMLRDYLLSLIVSALANQKFNELENMFKDTFGVKLAINNINK